MNCSECQRIIDDVADMDRLPPEAARHAAACAACERFGDDLGRLRSLLREPERVTAPEGFDAALARRLRAARQAKPARAGWAWTLLPEHGLAAAAAVVILLGAAVAVDRLGPDTPQPTELAGVDTPLPPPAADLTARPDPDRRADVEESPDVEPAVTSSAAPPVRVVRHTRSAPRPSARAAEPAESMLFVSDARGARVVSVPQVLVGSAPVVPVSDRVDPETLAVGSMSF